jgi:putative ABC transport system ATP-binding protein
MIQLNKIHKSYPIGKRKLHVLKGIDLSIKEGEMAAVMGQSGSGKSTLLNIIGLLDDYDEGEYFLDGNLIKKLSEKAAARYRNKLIGFVFQSYNLLDYKTAKENVALPLYYKGIPRSVRLKKAMEYLEKVGLGEWADHLPSEMSGGQMQRVAIARALITEPRLILADEPTGNLDSQTTGEVMELLQQINKQGVTMLIITHEPEIAEQTGRIIHLLDGQIVNEKEHV